MQQISSKTRSIPIGLMLFALFFGAGNLIFPASMGQNAGENIWWAVLGFCVTGVGLPLLAVMAVAYSGCGFLGKIASRVSPAYGLFYTVVCYMAIGPCFALPRTGTVTFEIAVRPFLPQTSDGMAMPIFLLVFFCVALWFAVSPSKLVDRIGKVLTPLLVLSLAAFIVQSFLEPMGAMPPAGEAYATPGKAVIQGILDGYNTLDAIAALIFASLVIRAVNDNGIKKPSAVSEEVLKSGVIAGALLALIYIFIAKVGAESVAAIGMKDTGAPILAESAKILFGHNGAVLLSVMVILACLTTAIGLISCTAAYFHALTRKMSYTAWAVIFTIVSYLIGLFGLKTIIVSTIPVLMFLYPLCVALVLLVFLHNRFGGARCVYVWTIGLTFIMALINGLETAQVAMPGFEAFLKSWVPLHSYGLGWISFAVVGFVIGLLQKAFTQPKAAA